MNPAVDDTPLPRACAECPVRDEAVCAALDVRQLDELNRVGRHRRFARGETIFAAGDQDTALATLISGAVKLAAVDASGTERIVALVHPAGLLGQLFGAAQDYEAVALTDSELCIVPRGDFERMLGEGPELLRGVLRRTSADLDASRALASLTGRRNARTQVIGLLLALARAAGPGCHVPDRLDLPLTRGEMAGLLGLTIETVSRQLSALEADHLIRREGGRTIHLLDPAALDAELA